MADINTMDPRLLQYLLAQRDAQQQGDGTEPQAPQPAMGGMPQPPMPPAPPPIPDWRNNAVPKTASDMQTWNQNKIVLPSTPMTAPPMAPGDNYTQQMMNTVTAAQNANDPGAHEQETMNNALMQTLPALAANAGSIGPHQGPVADTSAVQRYFGLINQLNQAKQQAPIQNNQMQLKLLQDLQGAKDKQAQADALAQGQIKLAGVKNTIEQGNVTPAQKTAKNLTPGQLAIDKQYAKDNSEFDQSAPQIEMDIKLLQEASDILGSDKSISSAAKGFVPDKGRAFTNPKAMEVKRKIKAVALRSLKETLPGVATDADREAVLDKAWNDYAETDINKSTVDNLLEQMKKGYANKKAKAKWFHEKGTLQGFQSPSSSEDKATPLTPNNSTKYNVGDEVTRNNKTFKFKGGDASKQENWQEVGGQ